MNDSGLYFGSCEGLPQVISHDIFLFLYLWSIHLI